MKQYSMNVKLKKNGFTVLEALTIVLIITILALIAIPNFIKFKERAKDENVVTNMTVLRVMLEVYRTDWQRYPTNLLELGVEANKKSYNKQVRNPYSNMIGNVGMPATWAMEFIGEIGQPGFVAYQYIEPVKYYLFGYDAESRLIKRNGKVFILSNG